MTINELFNEEIVTINTKKDADSLIDNMNDGEMFVITSKNGQTFIKKSNGKFYMSIGKNDRFVDFSRNYMRDVLYNNRTFNKIERK